MSVGEVMVYYRRKYTSIEIYEGSKLHTDYCKIVCDNGVDLSSDISDYMNREVSTYSLMDKDEYDTTILANSSVSADDYWNDGDMVLVILLSESK